MKWRILRLFLPLLILGFALPLVMRGPDGKPIMRPSDWLPDRSVVDPVTRVLRKIPRVTDEGPAAILEPEKIYKWKDEQGRWQFTDDPAQAPEGAVRQDLPEIANEIPPPESSTTETVVIPDMTDLSSVLDSAKAARDMAAQHNRALEEL